MIEFTAIEDCRSVLIDAIGTGSIDQFRVYSVDDDMRFQTLLFACTHSKWLNNLGRKTCSNDSNEILMNVGSNSIFLQRINTNGIWWCGNYTSGQAFQQVILVKSHFSMGFCNDGAYQ